MLSRLIFSRIGPVETSCDREQFEAEEFGARLHAVFAGAFPPRR